MKPLYYKIEKRAWPDPWYAWKGLRNEVVGAIEYPTDVWKKVARLGNMRNIYLQGEYILILFSRVQEKREA